MGNFGSIHFDYVEICACVYVYYVPIFLLLFIVSILIKIISHLKVYYIYYIIFPW